MTTPTPDPTPAPTPTPTPTPAPWHGGDAETVGYLQNRGWADKPVNEVARLAITAHQEAQRYLGHPADRLVRLPPNMDDAAAMAAVFDRLGRPKEATGYDFKAVKMAGDKEVPAEISGPLAKEFHEAGLTQAQAVRALSAVVKRMDGQATETAAERAATVAREQAELKTSWGANYDVNLIVAKNAARNLGVNVDAVAALEGQVGYKAVMEMFRALGVKMGEDKLLGGGTPAGGNGIMTREQAMSRMNELKSDREWSDRYIKGGSKEKREMADLVQLIAG